MQQIDQGVEWCLREVSKGNSIFIHCAHGHGRSATLMCACFLELGLASSIEHGISLMQSVRPLVSVGPRQRGLLELWYAGRLEAGGGAGGAHVKGSVRDGRKSEAEVVLPTLAGAATHRPVVVQSQVPVTVQVHAHAAGSGVGGSGGGAVAAGGPATLGSHND